MKYTRVDRPEALTALAHPVRRRILSEMVSLSSATTLAKSIGLTRQKVNYHLSALEAAGLIEFCQEELKGNCREKFFRRVGGSVLITPRALGELASETESETPVDRLLDVATRTIEEAHDPVMIHDGVVRFANETARLAFERELAMTHLALIRKYHFPGVGKEHRFFAGCHPAEEVKPVRE